MTTSRPSLKSLYVGDLNPHTTVEDLRNVFSPFGTILSVKIPPRTDGKGLGYAYINFETHGDAFKAKESCNYRKINGKPCRIMFADPSRPNNLATLFIKGLHPNIDCKRLDDLFSPFGTIISCNLKTDDEGKSQGYAYVQFDTYENAVKAVEAMNGKEVGSSEEPEETSTISVCHFQSSTQRSRMVDSIRTQTTVFVTNLPIEVTEEAFLEIMSSFGEVRFHRLTPVEAKNKKVGFVDFTTIEQAIKAVKELNQSCAFGGDPIETNFFQPKKVRAALLHKEYIRRCTELKEASKHKNLWVGSLPPSTTDESLNQMFSPFGNITFSIVMKTPNGESRQFGFVCFEKPEEANAALREMHRKLYPESRDHLKVCKFRTKHERTEYRRKKELLNQQHAYGHNMRVHHRALYHHSHKPTLPGTQTGSHTGAHTYAPGARNVPVPTVSNGTVPVPSFEKFPAAVSVPAAVPVVGHTEPEHDKEAFIKLITEMEDEEDEMEKLELEKHNKTNGKLQEPENSEEEGEKLSSHVYSREFIHSLRVAVSPLPSDVDRYIKGILESHKAAASRPRNTGNRGRDHARGSRNNSRGRR
ncbi:hypothetical protein GEMRC1_002655 [Eukaryota sp. GEM-RC1]